MKAKKRRVEYYCTATHSEKPETNNAELNRIFLEGDAFVEN